MKQPSFLHAGSTIGITCPSGFIPADKVLFAKEVLERWGYRVILGKTTGSEHFYFSATDEERARDLQQFLDDERVDAILMGRGGYGMSRIIDHLSFDQFIKHPKWICGFSDITVLHSHIHQHFNIATIHGPMCSAFRKDTLDSPHIRSLHTLLEGRQVSYPEVSNPYNIGGIAEGELVGGNLAMLAHLTGSVSQVDTKGKILFIEDISEYLYNIDRMLYNLKRSGQLSGICGMICGGFTDTQDTDRPFGQNIYEIVQDKVVELNIPVAFGFPAGHDEINFALKLGAVHTLEVTAGKALLKDNSLTL